MLGEGQFVVRGAFTCWYDAPMFRSSLKLLFLTFFFLGIALPVFAGTATSSPPLPSATLSQSLFTSLLAESELTGTAQNLTAPLNVGLFSMSANGVKSRVYDNPHVPVSHGNWSLTTPSFPNGRYEVDLSSGSVFLAEGSLTIGFVSTPVISSDFSVPPDPSGRLLRFTVRAAGGPISVGRVTFSFATSSADISGLTLSAYTDPSYTNPVSSTSAPMNVPIDPLDNTVAIQPTNALTIPVEKTYFFELDGTITASDSTYSIITTLLGDTEDVPPSPLSELGASNFVWSPDTYDVASATLPDWENASLLSSISSVGISTEIQVAPQIPPTCSMMATPAMATSGTPVTVSWTSDNATYSIWNNGTRDLAAGTDIFSMATTNQNYILRFYGPYGVATCFANVGVIASSSPATTTPALLDNFTASPTSGKPTLNVTFKGTVNEALSCSALAYTFSYGDGKTSSISVASKLCKPLAFTLTHSYPLGSYTAALYKGTYVPSASTTTAQLIQKQLITVNNSVAISNDLNNLANVFFAYFSLHVFSWVNVFGRFW